ncbi:MAG: hypothetical protein GEU82_19240 [Luteitalea sp.]|nr:hypothetical protein [Luteitalea sp.]
MLIEIARAVRLTLLGSHLQALNPGEIYDVAPAIGRVLVSDGWAIELAAERREVWNDIDRADDDGGKEGSGS